MTSPKFVSANRFCIVLNTNSFAKNSSGLVKGWIWINLDDIAFPSTAWDDFPVVVVSWWLEAAISLIDDTKNVGEFRFMDGPFSFTLEKIALNGLIVRLHRSGNTGRAILERTITTGAAFTAILEAASSIIEYCSKAGWDSKDLAELIERKSRMAQLMRNYSE